jgi:hypothetical protein
MSGISNENHKAISNNIVKLYESGSGIYIQNANGVNIWENQIDFSPTFSTTSRREGIRLLQASDNYLYDNLVSGISSSNKLVGIGVVDGDRNVLCCNIFENTFFGATFQGYCESTKLRHTTFSNVERGLVCLGATRIGEQIDAGNIWDEGSPFQVQAYHFSSSENDVIESRFSVPGNPGSATRPNYRTHNDVNVDWFISGPPANSCEADQDNCIRPELNRLAMNLDYTRKILEGQFSYGSYPETSDWEAKRVFYRSQKATSLEGQSNWSLKSRAFFGQHVQEKSALYKLTTIAQSLEEALMVDPLVTAEATKMYLLSDQLFSLDQTIEEGDEPTAAYLSERAALLEQKAEAFADFSSLLQQKQSDHTGLIAQLKQGNNSISTPIEAAMAMKAVNNWYFETMAEGLKKLPTSTESDLREMAERCPQRFGSAVGRAQSILAHYDKPFTPSDECKEGEKSGFKAPSNSDAEESAALNGAFSINNVSIFPNPASDVFTIQLPQNAASTSWNIELFDVRGQLLESQTSEGREVQFDATKFSTGVYLLRVQSEGRSISKRIVVQ